MSQSDYIKYKRVATELKNQQNNLAPVIYSGKYIDYKAFTLENTIISNKIDYTKIKPPSSVNVFGMQINNPSNCPPFILCSGTNYRVNRKPLLGFQSSAKPLSTPVHRLTLANMCICNHR
jgi:hypothetical protein